MNHFVVSNGHPPTLYSPLGSGESRLSSIAVLAPQMLEHGAYYAGKLGVRAVVARWHARKRRFVFGEFTLGSYCVRSVVHAAGSAAGGRFIPLSKTEPDKTNRVSDYAFETGA